MTELDMSVLLPLQEERAVGERCLRAWTEGQDHPRDRYEVIALAPGLELGLPVGVLSFEPR